MTKALSDRIGVTFRHLMQIIKDTTEIDEQLRALIRELDTDEFESDIDAAVERLNEWEKAIG